MYFLPESIKEVVLQTPDQLILTFGCSQNIKNHLTRTFDFTAKMKTYEKSHAVCRQRHEKRNSQIFLTIGQEVAPLCKLYRGALQSDLQTCNQSIWFFSLYSPSPETFGSLLMFLLTYGKQNYLPHSSLSLNVQQYKTSQH